nr:MAG TPA: hypothetical protein [Caudoviricetes sp.]
MARYIASTKSSGDISMTGYANVRIIDAKSANHSIILNASGHPNDNRALHGWIDFNLFY